MFRTKKHPVPLGSSSYIIHHPISQMRRLRAIKGRDSTLTVCPFHGTAETKTLSTQKTAHLYSWDLKQSWAQTRLLSTCSRNGVGATDLNSICSKEHLSGSHGGEVSTFNMKSDLWEFWLGEGHPFPEPGDWIT